MSRLLGNKQQVLLEWHIKNDICRIQELITLVDQNLESDNINLDALQPDKSELQLILNQVCENIAKLWSIGCLEESNAIQDNVDNITGTVYNRIRKINFILHSQQTSKSSNPRRPLTDVGNNNSPPPPPPPPASSDSTSEDITSDIILADAPTKNTQTGPTTTSAATLLMITLPIHFQSISWSPSPQLVPPYHLLLITKQHHTNTVAHCLNLHMMSLRIIASLHHYKYDKLSPVLIHLYQHPYFHSCPLSTTHHSQ